MSTRNIPQLPQIRGSLQATAGHVRDRARTVASALQELDRAEDDVRVGVAAVLQSIDDDRDPLLEEGEQLSSIIAAARQRRAENIEPIADPISEPVAPVVEPEPLAAPAAVVPEPVVVEPVTQVIEPEPQEAIGLPPAQEVDAPPARNHFNPRGWNWLQWVLATLFAIIAFFIAKGTVGWAISDLQVWDWLVPTLQGVIGFLWYVLFIAVGFFGGALLGFVIWNRWQNRNNHTPPPAPPAAPPAA